MKNIIFASTCSIILALVHTAYTTIAQDVQGSGLGENVGDIKLGDSGKVETGIEGYGEPEIGLDSANQGNTSLLSGTYNQSSHKKEVYKQGYFIQGHRGYTSYGRTYGDNGYVYSNQRHTGTLSATFNQGHTRNISEMYGRHANGVYNQGTHQRSHSAHASRGHHRNNQGGYRYYEHRHFGNVSVTYNNQGNFTNSVIKQGDLLGNGSHTFHGRSRKAQGGYDFPKQGYSGNISRTFNQGTFRNVILNPGAFVLGHGSYISRGHGINAHSGYGYFKQGHSGNISVMLNNQGNFKNLAINQGDLIMGHGVPVVNGYGG